MFITLLRIVFERFSRGGSAMENYDEFAYMVLAIVSEIPRGKILTYGTLAKKAGYPKNSRLVGKVLSSASLYGNYPCHRVVNATGRLVPSWHEQRKLLEDEGITFKQSGHVDVKKHLWD